METRDSLKVSVVRAKPPSFKDRGWEAGIEQLSLGGPVGLLGDPQAGWELRENFPTTLHHLWAGSR